jgi:hypothetical protein
MNSEIRQGPKRRCTPVLERAQAGKTADLGSIRSTQRLPRFGVRKCSFGLRQTSEQWRTLARSFDC